MKELLVRHVLHSIAFSLGFNKCHTVRAHSPAGLLCHSIPLATHPCPSRHNKSDVSNSLSLVRHKALASHIHRDDTGGQQQLNTWTTTSATQLQVEQRLRKEEMATWQPRTGHPSMNLTVLLVPLGAVCLLPGSNACVERWQTNGSWRYGK